MSLSQAAGQALAAMFAQQRTTRDGGALSSDAGASSARGPHDADVARECAHAYLPGFKDTTTLHCMHANPHFCFLGTSNFAVTSSDCSVLSSL